MHRRRPQKWSAKALGHFSYQRHKTRAAAMADGDIPEPGPRAARPVARPTAKAGSPASPSSSLPPVAAPSPVTA